MNRIYYAIGDIHGELTKLRLLHDKISNHHSKFYSDRPHTRIHLGDYVDRGPESCGVINYIQSLDDDKSFDVINLQGNHEIMMLEAHQTSNKTALRHWLVNGGEQTIESYKAQLSSHDFEKHRDWASKLPTLYADDARKLIFVHAGIDPDTYPEDEKVVHLWTRKPVFFESEHWTNPALQGTKVIHGHTPTLTDYPEISKDGRRINLDTGACYGGPLTAVVLAQDEKPLFLFSD